MSHSRRLRDWVGRRAPAATSHRIYGLSSAPHLTMIPSARRLMASLRDIGYDLPAAVADLVDNSIDADARWIGIDFGRAGAGSWIRVADDGLGMTARELDEAMRYGSGRIYEDRDLGRFG